MHFARTPLKVDASTAVTIVFGILGAILTILGVYFTFKQLQLAASRVQTQIDVGHSTNNVLGL
jgi:NAD-dependent oxidoreductase involved in siderophore biosynthesis